MADDSTTEVISIATGTSDGFYLIATDTGLLTTLSTSGSTLSTYSYSGTSPNQSLTRSFCQFIWPNALAKSPEGSMLDPSVFADVTLRVNSPTIIGSPSVTVWMAVAPAVTVNSTFWPGPTFPTPASAPDSGLTVHKFINVMQRVNGNQVSVAISVGENTLTLDPISVASVMNDQPGKTAWDLNLTFVFVVDDEFTGYPTANGSSDHSATFYSSEAGASLAPQLTIEHVPFHTGFMTHYEGRTRAVRDGRFGIPAFSAELVRDKYNKGIWVKAEHQDPDDGTIDYRRVPEVRTDNKGVR